MLRPRQPTARHRGRSDHVRSLHSTLSGPVVLAGHSYGGAMITNAGTGNPNGKALVVICAYAPDAGETLNQVLLSSARPPPS